MSFLSNPGDAATYAERVARQVPGLRNLHRMIGLLLAEWVPAGGRILVLGAGGGLELKALAEMQPTWRFDGVDPSAPMLDQARATLGDLALHVTFHEGYINDAPDGPFDGATCLLTLHFLEADERLRTLRELHRRLKPGAPLVTVHHSFPNDEAGKDKWLARNAALIGPPGMTKAQIENNIQVIKEKLPVLSPEQDVDLLQQAGFSHVDLFCAAFTFKGWVGYG